MIGLPVARAALAACAGLILWWTHVRGCESARPASPPADLSVVEGATLQRSTALPASVVGTGYAACIKALSAEVAGDWAGAVAGYEEAVRLDQESSWLAVKLAAAYVKLERPVDAMAALERLLVMDPHAVQARLLLGVLYASGPRPRCLRCRRGRFPLS